ncbi:DUF397 domain-containing protein [Streptomyces sp. NBC_00237]|uniref:DUF397 domain-containing protein n=1 Tax=Streptomyces sp. NBC_00237 TaxID=2975687 RepID=UPI0022504228|nr:DUF397 domain-containing protein [Streptomyces sp. NBC_00237]MCX5200957.1 DUF397 domain-containing protein [Streptomyces sp. NBC_00237]
MTNDALDWFKSSYSGGANTECVEVAGTQAGTAIRDSKARGGPRLAFNDDSWVQFVDALRSNRL